MITSADNQQLKQVRLLLEKPSQRRKAGLFVAEGVRMFLEAPVKLIEKIYVSEEFMRSSHHGAKVKSLPHEVVSDAVFKKISDTHTPQGVLMVLKIPQYSEERLSEHYGDGIYLLLNRIQDPGNLGTMIRTAEAVGAAGVIMDKECADLFNPKVIRSTMGSIYRVPFMITEDMASLTDRMRDMGVSIVAGDLQGEEFYDMPDPGKGIGILIGNEGSGLDPALSGRADIRLRIPMEGKVSSLNAAVSAALLLYQAKRIRSTPAR